MADMATLRSDTALVGYRQVHGEAGGATIACVVLADGFIVDCGSDGYSRDRANLLAAAINSFGASAFAFGRTRTGASNNG